LRFSISWKIAVEVIGLVTLANGYLGLRVE